MDILGRHQYSLVSFTLRASNYMATMGAYHRHLWDKIFPFFTSLSDERARVTSCHQEAMSLACQEHFAAKHVAAASKHLAAAISHCRHAWLRSANIADNAQARIEDLPFDSAGLFDAKTNDILKELQTLR